MKVEFATFIATFISVITSQSTLHPFLRIQAPISFLIHSVKK